MSHTKRPPFHMDHPFRGAEYILVFPKYFHDSVFFPFSPTSPATILWYCTNPIAFLLSSVVFSAVLRHTT